MKPVKREVTSVGVRDDKVAGKGKALMITGIIAALAGFGIYKSAVNWVTPEEFNDLVNSNNEVESESAE